MKVTNGEVQENLHQPERFSGNLAYTINIRFVSDILSAITTERKHCS
jgi:hypothetical protein